MINFFKTERKEKMKNLIERNRNVLLLLLLLAVLSLLVACGGNSPASDTANNNTPVVEVPRETPSALVGTKNAGGITYTAGINLLDPVEDKDIDSNGVPDRVEKRILFLYPGADASSTAKVAALVMDSREYNNVLSLIHSQLPKTKEEAGKIIYAESAFKNYCAFDKAFSITEFEGASREIFFANLNSALKVQRYKEIERLAGYQSLSRDCK